LFRRRPLGGGEVSVSFSAEETDLLRRLLSEYMELLESTPDPEDAGRARLFPAASLDDEDVARQFKELAESDLDKLKKNNVTIARDSLGDIGAWRGTLTEEQKEAWLVLLTDLRLVIGSREGVTEEVMERSLDPNDPAQWPLAVLHYLGALQESLVRAIS
jgi:alkanesulfonate monooxygenase SsuD/methylene tetrahydromethanopterin reductase-like flavin-dependent oxidoreductase (luciferase family)